MGTRLQVGTITVEVELKDIKNVHLSVHPPAGRVTVAAPARMSLDTIRVFALSKLAWIKGQQQKFRDQVRETPREALDRETYYVWGKRCLLSVTEAERPPAVSLKHNKMFLQVRPGTIEAKRLVVIEAWYREQVKKAVPALVAKWEPQMGVKATRFHVQRMKTRWGSCNHTAKSIRLNTDLAKKPRECLEYVVVHELLHLLEPTHNARFVSLMDRFMPQWRNRRAALNRLPVRHENWEY